MKRMVLLCASGVLALLTPLYGQNAAQPATVTATRNIDVVVTDHRGNRIGGLTQADFQILQDSKPQEITNFRELTRAGTAPDTDPPRRIVLAFDLSSLTLGGRKRSVEAARAFVASRLRPVDRLLVVELSSVGAATPVGSWTSDPAEIEKNLKTIDGRSAAERSIARRTAEQSIQMAIDFDKQPSTGSGTLITFDTLMQTARQFAAEAEAETLRTAGAIEGVVSFFSEGPGKKLVILAGGGLATRPGSDLFVYLEAVKQQAEMGQTGPGVQRGAKQANPRAEISRFSTEKQIRDLAIAARNRGVRMYAIEPDTGGSTQLAVERREAANTSADFTSVADLMSGYQLLTAETGGLALIGGSPADAVAQISADLDTHYSLAFQQTVPAAGAIPRVDVKVVKDGGYRVRSAFLGGPATRESEIKDAVVANHRGEISSNDLQIALAADPVTVDGENKHVKLRVLIPVKSLKLVPAGSDVAGAFVVYVCSGDEKGNAGAVSRQVHEFRWPADGLAQMMDRTIGYGIELIVPSVRTQISVGVMDQKSERTGYARLGI